MKHISTEIFVQVDTHVDYTIRFCGYLGVKFSALELEYKILLCIDFIGREQIILGSITLLIKKTIKAIIHLLW